MTDIKKIAVLLRVYSRIDDLLANLTIIRKRWSIGDRAYVVVSSNGARDGFHLPDEVYRLSDVVVELDENLGHIRGNAQLILKGLEKIPDETDFLIILEADTWLLNDEIIKKYINIMSEEKIVWCSSEWSRRFYSLGVDFAILDYKSLKSHLKILFDFHRDPEQYVAYYLMRNGLKFRYINELMPVHLPKVVNYFVKQKDKRLNVFIDGKMITHHIEHLKDGIREKYAYANALLGEEFFKATNLKKSYFLVQFKYRLLYLLTLIAPQSSWFKRKRMYNEMNYV